MWNDLSIQLKSHIMSMALLHGISDLKTILDLYNQNSINNVNTLYDDGGHLFDGSQTGTLRMYSTEQPTSSIAVQSPVVEKLIGPTVLDILLELRALNAANALKAPYNNYEDAVDLDDSALLRIKKALDYGVSNCTLTASQLFNPNMPIARAATIVRKPEKYGFFEVDEDHSIPGTMVISSEPKGDDYIDGGNKYHTMILSGYADRDYDFEYLGNKYYIKKGDPLLNYSRGKRGADNYVKNIPMPVYLDNSDGKTKIRYYRPISKTYGNVMLPSMTVEHQHANGGHLFRGDKTPTQRINRAALYGIDKSVPIDLVAVVSGVPHIGGYPIEPEYYPPEGVLPDIIVSALPYFRKKDSQKGFRTSGGVSPTDEDYYYLLSNEGREKRRQHNDAIANGIGNVALAGYLTPSLLAGATVRTADDLYNGRETDFWNTWLGGNAGVVTDKFAEEHPFVTMMTNLAFDMHPIVGRKVVNTFANSLKLNTIGRVVKQIDTNGRFNRRNPLYGIIGNAHFPESIQKILNLKDNILGAMSIIRRPKLVDALTRTPELLKTETTPGGIALRRFPNYSTKRILAVSDVFEARRGDGKFDLPDYWGLQAVDADNLAETLDNLFEQGKVQYEAEQKAAQIAREESAEIMSRYNSITDPILRHIVDVSPQYLEEAYTLMQTVGKATPEFLRNLIKRANSYRRYMREPHTIEEWKTFGSNRHKGEIHVEGEYSSGFYGDYNAYGTHPAYFEGQPELRGDISTWWDLRIPEGVNVRPGMHSGYGSPKVWEILLNTPDLRDDLIWKAYHLNFTVDPRFNVTPFHQVFMGEPGSQLPNFKITLDLTPEGFEWGKGYKQGGPITSDFNYYMFNQSLPYNLLEKEGDNYDMYRYWELNDRPIDFNAGINKGMFTKEEDDLWHAKSVTFNPITGNYEFLKSPNHESILKELEWYNSNNSEAVNFRRNYYLDKDTTENGYWHYRPRKIPLW